MLNPVLRKACLAAAALCAVTLGGCRGEEPEPPPVATPSFSVPQARVPHGSPVEVTYKFVVAKDAAEAHGKFPRFCAFSGCRQRTALGRRPRSARAHLAVEAGTGHRIHEDDVRADRPARRPDKSPDGALFQRIGLPSPARRNQSRPALLRRRDDRSGETYRGHFRDVQGRVASGGNAARQRRRRVAVDA